MSNQNNNTNITSEPSFNPISKKQFKNILANEKTLDSFCTLFEECLDTLYDVFPECMNTQEKMVFYKTNIKPHVDQKIEFIKLWHQELTKNLVQSDPNNSVTTDSVTTDPVTTDLYSLADQKNLSFWNYQIPQFCDIDMKSKLSETGFTQESVDVLWEYIQGMNRYSRMYNAIPSDMFDNIQSKTMEYIDKIQSGETKVDLENLNLDEIKTFAQSLMESINPKDIEDFTKNIQGLIQGVDINNFQDVAKFVGSLPGMGELNINENISNIFSNFMQNPATAQSIEELGKVFHR